jgi:sterol desaturase/sphingolipid hydroxylase (fatty acid hydroxylase superfamily)
VPNAIEQSRRSEQEQSLQREHGIDSSGPYTVTTIGTVAVLAVVSAATVAAVLASYFASQHGVGPGLSDVSRPWTFAKQVGETLLAAVRSPAPILVFALLLERWMPVSPLQRDLTRGFGQDLLWYLMDFLRQLSWIPCYLALLVSIKTRLIGSFALIPAGVLPTVVGWAVAILAWDLLSYLSHILRHRVDFLWRFHAIHHSQREMNFFTQHRFHDVDVVVDLTIRTLPLLALNASLPTLGIFYAVALAHFQLYHSSIRSNYGVLRYLLVNPQSHRVHHARDPRLHSRNFGIFFSIWDHAFGTQYPHSDEYPDALGIEDQGFPIEQGTLLRGVLLVYAAQVLYPFVQIGRPASRSIAIENSIRIVV